MTQRKAAGALVLLALALCAVAEEAVFQGVKTKYHEVVDFVEVDKRRSVITAGIDTRQPNRRGTYGHQLHRRNVDLAFNAFGREFTLELELNEDFLSPDFENIEVLADGSFNITKGVEHCYYRGRVLGEEYSLVALSTCHGLNGIVELSNDVFHFEPYVEEDVSLASGPVRRHVVYRSSDVMDQPKFECGTIDPETRKIDVRSEDGNSDHDHAGHAHGARGHAKFEERVDGLLDTVKRSTVAKRANKYVELLTGNDYQRYQQYGAADTQSTAINLVNIVAQRYANNPFAQGTVIVRHIGNMVDTAGTLFVPSSTSTVDANTLLNEWCAWRTQQLSSGPAGSALRLNDNGHLLSGRDFTSSGSNGVCGLAWVGTMCNTQYSCGIDEARKNGGASTDFQANTIAHEMGHNFDMSHDGSGNSCSSSGYIMASSGCGNCGNQPTTFSTCSANYINNWMPSKSSCLNNVPTLTFPDDANLCGNFVVDPGEQCDSGPSGSACCTSSCTFKSGAQCDVTAGPCCVNCQKMPTTHVCRAASGSCDVADYCQADLSCPDNKLADGASCGSGVCSSGTCTTRDAQCSQYNSYQFPDSSGTVKGPFTSCNEAACTLYCKGSNLNTCLNLKQWNVPGVSNNVAAGLPCTCSGNQVGKCNGSGTCTNCVAATQAPTTQAPTTQAPTQGPTTMQPTTQAPTTKAPTTMQPTTQAPTTPPPPPTNPTDCSRAYCSNHGECFFYFCLCDEGYQGSKCENPVLPPGCDGVPGSNKVFDACGVCGGDSSTCMGCDGVPNSGKVNDVCGVCGGNGQSCRGCDGVPNSGKVLDACGVCGGNNSTCRGCDGVINSGKVYDVCGVCGGNGMSCRGCDGVPNSGKVVDACGVCGGNNSTCRGCDGVINSGKIVDLCGVCGGDNTACAGCDGIPNSGKVKDLCGVCGGNNSTCRGCDGVPNSGKIYDLCGVCGGSNTACAGCDGVPNSGKVLDACGVCGGNNATCKGCDGVVNSGKIYDACGVCGGNGQTCAGCDGIANSGKVLDVCGVCGGNNSTCQGCDGVPNSGKVYDACGVCGGTGASCTGCDGIVNSNKVYDVCGVCGGNGQSCRGCDGVPNSGKVLDACGVCGGNNSTCKGCDGVINSGKVYDVCGVCNGNGMSCRGCDGVPNSGKVLDACGVCGGNNSTCRGCDGVINSGKVYDVCGVCGGSNTACAGCDGVPNSGKVVDVCGICGGNNSTCRGCDGVPNSGKIYDLCGVCGGSNTACAGCDGRPNSGLVFDACQVCGGDNSTCLGCDGVPNSGKVKDICGVCEGNGMSCRGCDGVAFSGKVMDACGICGGNNATCRGCDGVINSGKVIDVCGVCGGSGTSCRDCNGVINGTAVVDYCGVCGGDGTTCTGDADDPCSLQGKHYDRCGVCGGDGMSCLGCDGVVWSNKTVDVCGICGGDGLSCLGCDGVPFSGKIVDLCDVCGGNSSSCAGCDGVPNSGLVMDACGICGGTNRTCAGCDGVPNSGKVRDVCGECGGTGESCGGFELIPDPVVLVEESVEGAIFNVTILGGSDKINVFYTVDGSTPNPITSIYYSKPFLLNIADFVRAARMAKHTLEARDGDAPVATTAPTVQTADVLLQVQAFPAPGVPRLYKSFIVRRDLRFSKTIPGNAIVVDDGVTPLGAGVIAGAVIGGILGLALIAGAIWFAVVAARARKEEKEGRAKYRAAYAYTPNDPDELELRENDVIVLLESYDDGWARGRNERSRKEGVFPLSYTNRIDSSRLVLTVRPDSFVGRMSQRMSRAFGGTPPPSSPPPSVPPPKTPKPAYHPGATPNPLYKV